MLVWYFFSSFVKNDTRIKIITDWSWATSTVSLKGLTNRDRLYDIILYSHLVSTLHLILCMTGYCSRGGAKRLKSSEGGCWRHRGITQCSPAPLPADTQHHLRWEELYHNLPSAHRFAKVSDSGYRHRGMSQIISPSLFSFFFNLLMMGEWEMA